MSRLTRRALLAEVVGAVMAINVGKSSPSRVGRLIVSDRRVICGDQIFRCAIGRAGVRRDKTEGDGATPVGLFALHELLFRPDRLGAVETGLPLRALAPDDGWCDDPADPRYNRAVKLPYPARHEALWREDHLYDAIVVIGHNDAPPIPGKGSAIFMHVAAPDPGVAGLAPTAGCIALTLRDLLAIVRRCDPATMIEVRADPAAA